MQYVSVLLLISAACHLNLCFLGILAAARGGRGGARGGRGRGRGRGRGGPRGGRR